MDNEKTVGQLCFEAYVEADDNLTYDGKTIPPWGELTKKVQRRWHKAALRVLQFSVETGLFSTAEEGSDGEET